MLENPPSHLNHLRRFSRAGDTGRSDRPVRQREDPAVQSCRTACDAVVMLKYVEICWNWKEERFPHFHICFILEKASRLPHVMFSIPWYAWKPMSVLGSPENLEPHFRSPNLQHFATIGPKMSTTLGASVLRKLKNQGSPHSTRQAKSERIAALISQVVNDLETSFWETSVKFPL